jgi:peptidyl-prolyl cis-trans isomerase C
MSMYVLYYGRLLTLILGVACGICGVAGCRELSSKRPGQSKEKAATLAQIDDSIITVGDFEERLNNQSPYVRSRYAAIEQKKEFLDNLVKFEVLAGEAKRQGLDRDPEVVRTMKQVMIQKLLKQRFDRLKAEDIGDAEVQKYFDSHQEEFNRPPEVRVSMILVADDATAKKVLADPRSQGLENLGFRQLVTEYSIDQETKERGGDLRFFDANNRELPKELVDAAFRLVNVGDVSPAIKTQRGVAVLKLTGQRRALVRMLAEVAPQIRAKLFREKRQKLMDEYEGTLRKQAKIDVHPERLTQVKVDLTQNPPGAPDELRPAPKSGDYHPVGQQAPQASPARPGVPLPLPAAAAQKGASRP